jgi:hypothetical protein
MGDCPLATAPPYSVGGCLTTRGLARYLASLAEKMAKSTKSLTAADNLELDHKIFPVEEEPKQEEGAPPSAAGSPAKSAAGSPNKAAGEGKGAEGEAGGEKKPVTASIESALQHQVKETVLEQPKMMGSEDLRLKPYQVQGVQWLVSLYNNNLSGILADEMGLGKTIQVIGLLSYVFESKGDQGPFMIIAPLSTITNWESEFQRWAPIMDVVVYKGNKEIRKELFRSKLKGKQFHVLIIQYEMVMKSEDLRQLKTIPWSYIIVDEGHRNDPPTARPLLSLCSDRKPIADIHTFMVQAQEQGLQALPGSDQGVRVETQGDLDRHAAAEQCQRAVEPAQLSSPECV